MSITNCDEFYLKKYKNYISVIVNKFIAKGNQRCLHIKDDLFQEAQLALLKWINKQKCSEFDVSKSFMDINNALYEYIKCDSGVHMNRRKFSSFCNECQFIPIKEDDISSDFCDVDYMIDVKKWEEGLSSKQQKILHLKLCGLRVGEISKALNISRRDVARIIHTSIRNSYNAYFHPEQNPAPVRKRKSKSTLTAA